jgi:protein disulfide-isomerase
LRNLAKKCELDPKGVEQALTGEDSLKAVTRLEEEGYSLGIKGVPFFLLLSKYCVSGAQPPEFWRDALPKIASEASAVAS